MKILLTGANGFIGEYLYDVLKFEGHEIETVTRRCETRFGDENTACDLEQTLDLDPIIGENEVVIHLAGRAHVMTEAKTNQRQVYESANSEVTRRLAESALRQGVHRFVFLSSVKVNGERTRHDRPFTNGDTPNPQEHYGHSKMIAEEALRNVCEGSSMDYVIIRTPLVYGKGVRANFASLIRIVKFGFPLPLKAIKNQRSFISLYNLGDAISKSITVPTASNSTLLVSDGQDLSTPDLAKAIARAYGLKIVLIWVPTTLLKVIALLFKKFDWYSRLCDSLTVDIEETKTLLQWTPRFSVAESLKKMAEQ